MHSLNYIKFSGLHLYHHWSTPLFAWLSFKLSPTFQCFWINPLINTLIHVIMYSYYALSAFGPKVQKYLWWKKYLTQLQMIQFVIFGFYAFIFLKNHNGHPIQMHWVLIGENSNLKSSF
jgi:elongation of very long chain fatty acids protein 4